MEEKLNNRTCLECRFYDGVSQQIYHLCGRFTKILPEIRTSCEHFVYRDPKDRIKDKLKLKKEFNNG